MPKTAYPTSDALLTFLQSVGLFDNPPTSQQDAFDLDLAVSVAVDEWEQRTGFKPFLADTVDTTWLYEADLSSVIDLEGGFVSITSVTLNTVVRTLNTDYRIMPRNALANNKPITYLLWNGLVRPFPVRTGQASAVTVTGKRGYAVQLSDQHYRAILRLAALPLLSDLAQLKTDGVIKSKQGDTEYTYAGGGLVHIYSGLEAAWMKDIAAVIPKRVRIA